MYEETQNGSAAPPPVVVIASMSEGAWNSIWNHSLGPAKTSLANHAAPLMTDGGSMIALSYYGSDKAVPGYNVMGVAKAALEATTRYLALELGEKEIRVNCISGGPLRTMSAMAVGGFGEILDWVEKKAPLKRNIEGREVGDCAAFLLSGLSSGMTGQCIYVDSGYATVGL